MNLQANLSSSLLTYLENTHSAAVLTQGQGEEGLGRCCVQAAPAQLWAAAALQGCLAACRLSTHGELVPVMLGQRSE